MDQDKALIETLQEIPCFQKVTEEHFNKLAEISTLKFISKDEVLFNQGDTEKDLYVLVEGRIGVDINSPIQGHIRVYTAEPMDVVGWSSATPVVRQRTASAKAVLDSRLVAIDAAKLDKLCEEDHHLGYIVMRRLANALAARLMIARLHALELYASLSEEKEYA